MKKFLIVFMAAVLALSLVACTRRDADSEDESSRATENSQVRETSSENEESNILVAYFSATGNTKAAAEKLADKMGADLYEITPRKPYTREDLDYGNSQSRSSLEMNDPDARPEISGSVENMEQYDMVFIGYPIWWGKAPRIMSTFIESYDFQCKTLVAFCTSASSGFGESDSALKEAADDARWLPGHRFSENATEEDVRNWLGEIKID